MTIEVDFEEVFDDWIEIIKSRSFQTNESKRNDVEAFVERSIGSLRGSSDSAYILIKLLHKESTEARKLAIAELREDEVIQ